MTSNDNTPAPFLPRTRAEMRARGWDALDVVLVTGDGYVDHPSFGVAVIGRVLEARGYRVGILDVPEIGDARETSRSDARVKSGSDARVKSGSDARVKPRSDAREESASRADAASSAGWQRLPAPELFVGVSAGTIDSMVTNYTAAKKKRRIDVYRPGGSPGRPNRATIGYTALARHHFPGVPVIIGGLEAGPRRLAYFDYWEEKMRRSILVDSKADLLAWGMAERQVIEIAERLSRRRAMLANAVIASEGSANTEIASDAPSIAATLSGIAGACEILAHDALPPNARIVPSFEELAADPEKLIDLFHAVREENSPSSRPLAQKHGTRFVVQHPPMTPPAQAEVDSFYDLPYRREWHPDHTAAGGIAALEPVRWSLNTHRGCMADCSFCSITFHQGRTIQSRSEESVLREAAALAAHHDFRGTITDVGGPTANMYGLGCKLLEKGEPCLGRDCLTPDPCPALRLNKTSEGYRRLLSLVRGVKGVKHSFVSSGIRYDMLRDKKGELLPLHHDLVRHHVPGRMKLAPEHASEATLRAMNKPTFDVYEQYESDYKDECKELGRDQHLVNYFIVGHPGTTLADAIVLFEKLLARNYSPEQVQEFIPLPMTRACVQYVTGKDPMTLEELHVPRGEHERRVQKALVRWKAPESKPLVEEALLAAGRTDLLERFQRALKAQRRREHEHANLDLDTCG